MSMLYNWYMEQEERGWYSLDKSVCANCVDNPSLKMQVTKCSSPGECDYCESKAPVAKFDSLMEFIMDHVHDEWEDPVQHQPYEGGYVFEKSFLSTEDLLEETGIECHDDLREDIIGSINIEQWVSKDFFILNPVEALRFGWRDFVDLIKHENRYFFGQARRNRVAEINQDPNELDPAEILTYIGNFIESFNLVTKLNSGKKIFRARFHKRAEIVESAARLGTCPKEYAKDSNRMSAAGIPMFYGAVNLRTAILEASGKFSKGLDLTFGKFQNTRDLTFVDLRKIPEKVDHFAHDYRDRHALYFLRSFKEDFMKPVPKDGAEHVEYVPTQVVTEYFRQILTLSGTKIDGVIYPSSITGEASCVIFAENEHCFDSKSSHQSKDCFLKLLKLKNYQLTGKKQKLRKAKEIEF